MKNIHILPTDKPSRLFYSGNSSKLTLNKYSVLFRVSPQNIYITSDEEIENCWFVNLTNNEIGYIKNNIGPQKNAKKIILTTDQDLIKDGVQAIDDEFLEWFVKNPSCGYVEVEYGDDGNGYQIIIPKEEQNKKLYSEEDVNHLEWIYNRMISLHNENKDYDYMVKFKEILDQFKTK